MAILAQTSNTRLYKVSNLEEISLLQNFDEKLRRTCDDLNLLDPIVLLVGLANGKDLTNHSLLYQWVLNHEAENGEEPPDVFEWLELLELIKEHARFVPTTEGVKLQAQKTLAEYQHNKKKSIELTDKSVSTSSEPLKRSEVRRFERIFKNEY